VSVYRCSVCAGIDFTNVYVFSCLFRSKQNFVQKLGCMMTIDICMTQLIRDAQRVVFVIVIIHVIFSFSLNTFWFYKFCKTSFLFLCYFRSEHQHRFCFHFR